MYVKVENGSVVETMGTLPECTDAVSGFNLLTPDEQAQHGYFPLVEVKPTFDPATEKLTGPAYTFGTTQVTATYTKVSLSTAELANALTTAQNNKYAELNQACANAIVSGFTSSALGTAHTYPSTPIDQSNLIGAVASGLDPVQFWCADSNGAWALTSHTAVQIKQVLADGATKRIGYSVKLAGLADQVNKATSVAAVQAIVW